MPQTSFAFSSASAKRFLYLLMTKQKLTINTINTTPTELPDAIAMIYHCLRPLYSRISPAQVPLYVTPAGTVLLQKVVAHSAFSLQKFPGHLNAVALELSLHPPHLNILKTFKPRQLPEMHWSDELQKVPMHLSLSTLTSIEQPAKTPAVIAARINST